MTWLLLSLVRSGIRDVPPDKETLLRLQELDEDGWNSLIQSAADQTVSGWLYKALEKCSKEEVPIPEKAFWDLMTKVNSMVHRNLVLGEVEKEGMATLSADGLHPVVMKGSRCAALYPFPELREAGDVDLFLPGGELSLATKRLAESGQPATHPDGSVVFIRRDCIIELHGKYYDLHVPEASLPPVPSAEAEVVMLAAHILKHACGVGIGLRQLLDYTLASEAFPGDRDELEKLFQRLGLIRWNKLLLSFLSCDSERSLKRHPLYRIVNRGGNFGHHARTRKNLASQPGFIRKMGTAFLLIGRLPFSLRYAPREALLQFWDLVRGNLISHR